jgi:hypothetical protein
MKICYKKDCEHNGVEQSLDNFSTNKNKPDGFNSECRDCANKYMRQYYKKNKDKHKEAVQKGFDYKRAKIGRYKLEHGCSICGYNEHPSALCFHHLDPEEKEFTIGSNIHLPWEILLSEIEKCEVLCMNCHAVEHSKYDWTVEKEPKKTKKRKPVDLTVRKIIDPNDNRKKRSKSFLPVKKSNIPDDNTLKKLLWEYPAEELAKKFNCSGSYLSKYCKQRNIEKPPRGHWTKKKM